MQLIVNTSARLLAHALSNETQPCGTQPSPGTLTVMMLFFRLQALESNPQQRAKYLQECDMVQMLGTLLENTAIPTVRSSLL